MSDWATCPLGLRTASLSRRIGDGACLTTLRASTLASDRVAALSAERAEASSCSHDVPSSKEDGVHNRSEDACIRDHSLPYRHIWQNDEAQRRSRGVVLERVSEDNSAITPQRSGRCAVPLRVRLERLQWPSRNHRPARHHHACRDKSGRGHRRDWSFSLECAARSEHAHLL